MRALVAGLEGGELILFKAADTDDIRLTFMEDDGTPVNLTTSIHLEVHSSKIRGTPVTTLNGVIDNATGGIGHLDVAAAAANFGPGTYYGFGRAVIGADVRYGDLPVKITVK